MKNPTTPRSPLRQRSSASPQPPPPRRRPPSSPSTGSIDHTSTVPAIAGQKIDLFVREKIAADLLEQGSGKPFERKVVLMVHGGFSPATLAFDVRLSRLFVDGAPRPRRLRRLRDGHDRLRAIGPADDGRALQPDRGPPEGAGGNDAGRALPAEISARARQQRQRDRRHQRGRRLHPPAARRRQGFADRLVRRRHPHRHLRGALSREGRPLCDLGVVQLQPQESGRGAGAAQGGRADGVPDPRRRHRPALARDGEMRRHGRAGNAGDDLRRSTSSPIRSARPGARAACARRHAPIGAGTPTARRRSRCRR